MSKIKPLSEILKQWNGLKRPKTGETYQHYKGGLYTIVGTGFLEDSETPAVIYKSQAKDIIWVRTAKNFLEKVEHNGQTVPRFKKV